MAQMTSIDKLTLKEMIEKPYIYRGLPEGLAQLPVPDVLTMKRKKFSIPADMEEFTANICYGQRVFLMRKEEGDIGIIIRVIDGYYYPLFTNNLWDEQKALLFGKIVITCKVIELYPIAMHIVTLINEMAEREQKLLHREPSKMEKAAGIEKLNIFSELTAVDFLRNNMGKTEEEVMLTPYDECLVRFMLAKETSDFQERYLNEVKRQTEPKSKFK
jgi:hypothetical protein